MISFLDSTMLETYKRCPREFYFSFVRNLRPLERNWHFHAGGTMARALEMARRAWLDGQDDWKEEGFRTLIESYGPDDSPIPAKSLDRLMLAYAKMWDVWPPDKGLIVRHVEFTFSVPLPLNLPNGEPVFYSGRCDWIGELNGSLFIVDEKTTSSLGPTWANSWPMRGQLIGYVYAARAFGIPARGAVVRGIALTQEPAFAESILFFPDHTIQLWLDDTIRWVERVLKDQEHPRTFGEPCARCSFREVCSQPNPSFDGFEERNWDPLRR